MAKTTEYIEWEAKLEILVIKFRKAFQKMIKENLVNDDKL